jgi:hypothetical protein
LKKRNRKWLHRAVEAMSKEILRDWKHWGS